MTTFLTILAYLSVVTYTLMTFDPDDCTFLEVLAYLSVVTVVILVGMLM